jgi:hypothetical protein
MADRESWARRLWTLLEPVHAVTYFAPQARSAFEAAGLKGFWRGYFAGRAAPLGPVGAAPVTALFFGFAPSMVERALPDVWGRADPQQALEARAAGAQEALEAVLSRDSAHTETLEETLHLLDRVLDALDCSGRMLGAANAALPRPATPVARLWQAATTLREHRGDGHVAALMLAGLDGCESLVLRAGIDQRRDLLQPARGWEDAQWVAAMQRLAEAGWLSLDGQGTPEGRLLLQEVEGATDAAAASAWSVLADDELTALEERLVPMADAAASLLPFPNQMGLSRA